MLQDRAIVTMEVTGSQSISVSYLVPWVCFYRVSHPVPRGWDRASPKFLGPLLMSKWFNLQRQNLV